MKLKSLIFTIITTISIQSHAEMSQSDVDINFKELDAFWLQERCKESNVDAKCWIPIENKKDLYGGTSSMYLGMQKIIPAKADVLQNDCGEFPYTTGFTTTNLPNKAVCVEFVGANQARFFYPKGMTENGLSFNMLKSSKTEFMRRVDEKNKERLKNVNF
jgi:hypothetical protein